MGGAGAADVTIPCVSVTHAAGLALRGLLSSGHGAVRLTVPVFRLSDTLNQRHVSDFSSRGPTHDGRLTRRCDRVIALLDGVIQS